MDQSLPNQSLVLVTGATGLLGSNLVRELVARGYRIRALVRSAEKAARYLADLAVEVIVGDLRNIEGFADALRDCHAVFNTAAYFREFYRGGDHRGELEQVNVRGTLKLMQAADASGVRCFIHTSSTGTLGIKSDGSPGDEETPASAEQLRNQYFQSKLEADRRVRTWQPPGGMRVVTVLPGWMWGPGDSGPTAAGQCALDFIERKIPAVPHGGTNVVDARDVASAMISCLERAQHGSRFVVAGPFRTLRQLFQELEKLTGIPAPVRKVPFDVALAFAAVAELRAQITGGKLLVSRAGLRLMRSCLNVSSSRAERELGVRFRPLDQTLTDTLRWYSENTVF